MDLTDIHPEHENRECKRVGRGHGSGSGKTCGRGTKGQKARNSIPPGFEGGQTPLYKRLPKLPGESNKAHNIGIFQKEHTIVNVRDLNRFDDDAEVTPERLQDIGLIGTLEEKGLKILGDGELERSVTVRAHAFSASAREKIEAAGGAAEVIE